VPLEEINKNKYTVRMDLDHLADSGGASSATRRSIIGLRPLTRPCGGVGVADCDDCCCCCRCTLSLAVLLNVPRALVVC
jgi:hypothetical protein